MLKFFKNWILYILFVWILACQALFILIQESFGQKVVESIQGQLRQELAISNFNFLARSITDFTISGAIECGVLTKLKPNHQQIIDLRYMSQNCSISKWSLDGVDIDVKLRSLNGDIYDFQFVSKNPSLFYLALWGFRILGGLAIFGISFAMRAMGRSEAEVAKRMKAMALQVSHDIRSPLSALKTILKDKKFENSEEQKVVMASLERMQDIANNLLQEEKTKSVSDKRSYLIVPMIESVLSEKRFQFSYLSSLEFVQDLGSDSFLSTAMDESKFKIVLSNLINNAIEASTDRYQIDISLKTKDRYFELIIKDYGVGIPQDIIDKVGIVGFSSKKNRNDSGTGIGLATAISSIKECGGNLIINSQMGKGTEIIIELPIAESPLWLQKEITLALYDEVWILDDDPSIPFLWRNKISDIRVFNNIDALKKEFNSSRNVRRLYLIDFELGSNISGVELIKELEITDSSIIVTSVFERVELQDEAIRNQFKIIPKVMIENIKVIQGHRDYYDAVYIDDDQILRIGWENQARKKNINLLTLSNATDINKFHSQISKNNTKIYIDSNLGPLSMKGEELALHLHSHGFRNLHLATGYDQNSFEHYPWLKIQSKDCPF